MPVSTLTDRLIHGPAVVAGGDLFCMVCELVDDLAVIQDKRGRFLVLCAACGRSPYRPGLGTWSEDQIPSVFGFSTVFELASEHARRVLSR